MNFLEKFKRKKLGLALGGGSILGAAHIGALKTIVKQIGINKQIVIG